MNLTLNFLALLRDALHIGMCFGAGGPNVALLVRRGRWIAGSL